MVSSHTTVEDGVDVQWLQPLLLHSTTSALARCAPKLSAASGAMASRVPDLRAGTTGKISWTSTAPNSGKVLSGRNEEVVMAPPPKSCAMTRATRSAPPRWVR